MNLSIQVVTSDLIKDLSRLFSSEPVVDSCWCMWFITPIKTYHTAGSGGNCASFCEMVARDNLPPGLLAYHNEEPVGWCAVGPRTRYVRALKTPTYNDGNINEAPGIWLTPCFFIRKDMRRKGISQALLNEAIHLASENGATAIDGFPYSGAKKRSVNDLQVGYEALFAACGFEVLRRPSTSRVVMRRELNANKNSGE